MQKKPRIVIKTEESQVLSPELTKKTEAEFVSLLDQVGYPDISTFSSQARKTSKKEELSSIIDTIETALTLAEQETQSVDQLGKFAEDYLASKKPALSPASSYPFPKHSSFQPSISSSKTQEILNVPVGGTWSAFAIQFRRATKDVLKSQHPEKNKESSKLPGKEESDSKSERSDEEGLPYYYPKLRKEDAELFGYFPSKEPLVVVKCNHCFKVIKASHFSKHMTHCPHTPDLDVFTMEDLIGKNRTVDKNKKKDKLSIPKGSKQNSFEDELEEEEAIYAPPKKSKNGGKKVKSAHSESVEPKKNKKKDKKASKKKAIVEIPQPVVVPPTPSVPPVETSTVEEEVLEEGGSPSSYSTVVPPPPLMTVPVAANRMTLRRSNDQLTPPPQVNLGTSPILEETSATQAALSAHLNKKKKLKTSHDSLEFSQTGTEFEPNRTLHSSNVSPEVAMGTYMNNSNIISTPIHSTRQNGPQTNSPPVNNSQLNKLNVVSINVKTGEFIQRPPAPTAQTVPNPSFVSMETISPPDENKPKQKQSRRRMLAMQRQQQLNNLQYQTIPGSPGSPNAQPTSPNSPMQSPMAKSPQYINKPTGNVPIRTPSPGTFQPASFSYQAQPHGYLAMHQNGSLPQDPKMYVAFSSPQMGYPSNGNGSPASPNMATHHVRVSPHMVQMSNGHVMTPSPQNGQVFMTSGPYTNPQPVHLQRFVTQVPNSGQVTKQPMNTFVQTVPPNGMHVMQKQNTESENMTGMNFGNAMNNNNTLTDFKQS